MPAFDARDSVGVTGALVERLLTPQEIAEAWQLDANTIRRIFQDQPGVMTLKFPQAGKKKRRYTTLRIPAAVVERVQRERSK